MLLAAPIRSRAGPGARPYFPRCSTRSLDFVTGDRDWEGEAGRNDNVSLSVRAVLIHTRTPARASGAAR